MLLWRGFRCDSLVYHVDRYGQSGHHSNRRNQEEEEEQGAERREEEDGGQEMETEEPAETRRRQFHLFVQLRCGCLHDKLTCAFVCVFVQV